MRAEFSDQGQAGRLPAPFPPVTVFSVVPWGVGNGQFYRCGTSGSNTNHLFNHVEMLQDLYAQESGWKYDM